MSGFREGFEGTLLAVARSRELFSTIVLAAVLYAFFYPLPYAHQVVRKLPVVVVDREDSALTRQIVRDLATAREVRVVGTADDFPAAERAVRDRDADGILFLPRGFERALRTGAPGGGVGIWVNGAYLLRARDIGAAVAATIRGVAVDRLGPAAGAFGLAPPVRTVIRPMFNTREGYKDYVFPAVAIIILQQTLLFGSATFMADRRERGVWRMARTEYLGCWAAFALIGTLAMLLYFGLFFWVQDVPRGGDVAMAAAAAPLFATAVAALGLLVGSTMDHGYRAMQILVPTSVPMFFLTGAAWPLESMPWGVAALAHVSPATAGVHLFVRLNQMGARPDEVLRPLAALAALAILAGIAAFARIARRGTGGG